MNMEAYLKMLREMNEHTSDKNRAPKKARDMLSEDYNLELDEEE